MPHDIVLVHAHPYPDRSRAGRLLLQGVKDIARIDVRMLYSLYPDFAIDVKAEQEALARAGLVVWQTPFYWYGVPALLHLWFEKVLAHGWAYGPGGTALTGKHALWAVTTGASERAYRPGGVHGYKFDAFVPPVEQTARFCGMRWSPPLVLHAAHQVGESVLQDFARSYRQRLEELAASDEKENADG